MDLVIVPALESNAPQHEPVMPTALRSCSVSRPSKNVRSGDHRAHRSGRAGRMKMISSGVEDAGGLAYPAHHLDALFHFAGAFRNFPEGSRRANFSERLKRLRAMGSNFDA